MSDIRDTIANLTKNVTKTSGDLFKSTKLSMAVSTELTTMKNLYLEIGKKVHEIYQYGGTLGKFFDEKYRELEACEMKIEELKEQISQIKGTRECSKCGKTAERTAEFCPKCGMRMAPGVSPQEEQAPKPDMELYTAQTPAPQPEIPPAPKAVSAPEPALPPAAAAPATDPPKAVRNCRVCGTENDMSTKFCLSCGRIVD